MHRAKTQIGKNNKGRQYQLLHLPTSSSKHDLNNLIKRPTIYRQGPRLTLKWVGEPD